MHWILFALAAWAGPVEPITVTRAPQPSVATLAEWTRVGAVPTGGTSPFAAGVSVWCKVESGCEMRDTRGHVAAVTLAADAHSLTFGPKEGVSYKALGPATNRWSLVLTLGNKEWSDDWLAPLAR